MKTEILTISASAPAYLETTTNDYLPAHLLDHDDSSVWAGPLSENGPYELLLDLGEDYKLNRLELDFLEGFALEEVDILYASAGTPDEFTPLYSGLELLDTYSSVSLGGVHASRVKLVVKRSQNFIAAVRELRIHGLPIFSR